MNPVEYNLHIKSESRLTSPQEIYKAYPITPQIASVIERGRKSIREILTAPIQSPRRLIVVCGPCSIHAPQEALEYAGQLKKIQDEISDRILLVMRCYFEKPRTVMGWKGLIYDPDLNGSYDFEKGIRTARKLLIDLARMGIYPATEILDPILTQYIADLICWAAIGARTTESQPHRQLVSGLSMPVGFKNATNGNIQVAVDAVLAAQAEHAFLGLLKEGSVGVFRTTGNPDCHIILRGGSKEANYSSEWIAYATEKLKKAALRENIFVDCSHANSNKDFKRQMIVAKDLARQIQEGNRSIAGIMLESNLLEGSQPIKVGAGCSLQYGISVTDACVGIEETRNILQVLYESLEARM